MVNAVDLEALGWLTIEQFAERNGVGSAYIRRLCKEGRLEGANKAGGIWIIPTCAEKPTRQKPGPQPNLTEEQLIQMREDIDVNRKRVNLKYKQMEKDAGLNDRQQAMLGWIKAGYRMTESGIQYDQNGEVLGKIAGWETKDFVFWQFRNGKVRPDADSGSPVIGYCSAGGSHKTIRATADEVRRMYPQETIWRNGKQV